MKMMNIQISMWAYNLMVNNIAQASTFLWKIIKLKYYFLTIYSDLLSKYTVLII